MYKDKTVGVVVPAFNEEKLIGCVIETMPDFVDHIYVVDDCSHDGTPDLVRSYQDQPSFNGRLELIRHTTNCSVGRAIVTGSRKAAKSGLDVVAVIVGNAQMDSDDPRALLAPVVADRGATCKRNGVLVMDA